MSTDSRCCRQYRALSISRSYNSRKDFLKRRFRASNTNFFARLFAYSSAPRGAKSMPMICCKKKKKHSKYRAYTLLWQITVTFTKRLTETDVQKVQHLYHAPTKSVIKPVDLHNACCVQLSLVLRECVNHYCTEIPCKQLFLSCMAFSIYESSVSLVRHVFHKPKTLLTSEANDFANAKSDACKRAG